MLLRPPRCPTPNRREYQTSSPACPRASTTITTPTITAGPETARLDGVRPASLAAGTASGQGSHCLPLTETTHFDQTRRPPGDSKRCCTLQCLPYTPTPTSTSLEVLKAEARTPTALDGLHLRSKSTTFRRVGPAPSRRLNLTWGAASSRDSYRRASANEARRTSLARCASRGA